MKLRVLFLVLLALASPAEAQIQIPFPNLDPATPPYSGLEQFLCYQNGQPSRCVVNQVPQSASKLDLAFAGLVLSAHGDNINCNATGDTQFALYLPATNWMINLFQMVLVSGTPGSATMGLYTGPGQTGITIAAQTSLPTASGLNTANAIKSFTPAVTSAVLNATTIYANIGVAAGGACVVSVYFIIRPLP
jgi:hypothetical protein